VKTAPSAKEEAHHGEHQSRHITKAEQKALNQQREPGRQADGK